MADVRIYHARLAYQTNRMASRFINRVLNEMLAESKVIAAVGPYTRGNLARSLRKVGPNAIGTLIEGQITTHLSYAKAVESGAKIHNIFPRGAPHVYRFGRVRRPALKFEWHGRTVYANQIPMAISTIGISHPGQKAKHYLLTPLKHAAVRHRLKIVVYET